MKLIREEIWEDIKRIIRRDNLTPLRKAEGERLIAFVEANQPELKGPLNEQSKKM